MEYRVYRLAVRRRRGQWHATAPELPGRDAPRFSSTKLANLPADATIGIARYLGVSEQQVGVRLEHPARPVRKLPGAQLAQAVGGLAALGGVYALGGVPVTLLVAGVILAALGVLRESGRI